MVDLTNIKHFTTDRPENWTLLGSPEDFDRLPEHHKAQILFLDKAADKFIYEFSSSAKLITGDLWEPFAKGNFKTVDKFSNFSDSS